MSTRSLTQVSSSTSEIERFNTIETTDTSSDSIRFVQDTTEESFNLWGGLSRVNASASTPLLIPVPVVSTQESSSSFEAVNLAETNLSPVVLPSVQDTSSQGNLFLFEPLNPADVNPSSTLKASSQVVSHGQSVDSLLGVNPQTAPPSVASLAVPQVASAATNDVLYTFYYVYGNGDYYAGYGYADANQGYYAGQYITPVYDETYYYEGYNPGYYYIATVADTGADYNAQNQVYVTQYFDAETYSFASYLQDYYTGNYGYGSGYYGLGSELGYAYDYSLTNNDPFFGTYAQLHYEADLTSV